MLAEPNIESGADIEVSLPSSSFLSSCLFSFGQQSDYEQELMKVL
jgi:hypothetical protein